MADIIVNMSVSLDGYIAGPGHDVSEVFGWHQAGDDQIPLEVAGRGFTLHLSEKNHAWFRRMIAETGVILCGRGLFDMVGGWSGRHPIGAPIVCHSRGIPEGWENDDRVVFEDDLVKAAERARELAGDKVVSVAGSRFVKRMLEAGLVDAVALSVVPVILGDGVPFFDHIAGGPIRLSEPVIETGDGVTHMTYRILK